MGLRIAGDKGSRNITGESWVTWEMLSQKWRDSRDTRTWPGAIPRGNITLCVLSDARRSAGRTELNPKRASTDAATASSRLFDFLSLLGASPKEAFHFEEVQAAKISPRQARQRAADRQAAG